MSFTLTIDRVLIGVSASWLLILLALPGLHEDAGIFWGTALLVGANTVVTLAVLTTKRKILVGLNCTQIVLFGVLSYLLSQAHDQEHYLFDAEPGLGEWAQFTAAHFIRAADVLDVLDEYGIVLQTIKHNSLAASVILVCMHIFVDVFLIGLALRWLGRFWQTDTTEDVLTRGRRRVGWLLLSLFLFLGCGLCQNWSLADWLLWPLDNVLRVLDLADMFQIFGWRLHDVDMGFYTKTYAIFFRLSAGIWLTQLILWARLTVCRGWGLLPEDLVAILEEGDSPARYGAARALGTWPTSRKRRGPCRRCMKALRDSDLNVRREAALALGHMGSAARWPCPPWPGRFGVKMAR